LTKYTLNSFRVEKVSLDHQDQWARRVTKVVMVMMDFLDGLVIREIQEYLELMALQV
jgi:hypothetical protein